MSKPTDTNQASELYELCREVYERTGWEAPETYKAEDGNPENDWQAYNTDYLLEELPKEQFTQPDFVECLMVRKDSETSYTAGYFLIIETKADTPLKALLKLTIALSEAGVKL